MPCRQLLGLTSVLFGASLVSACGSPPSPTPSPTQSFPPTPSASASGTPVTFGTLSASGQVSDTLSVQSQVPCDQVQGLSVQGSSGSIYQLLVTDQTPGTTDISTQTTQVSVELSGATSAGTRVDWAGGSGKGTGTITAPPTAANGASPGPGMFTLNVMLPSSSGAGSTGTEHIAGSWSCG